MICARDCVGLIVGKIVRLFYVTDWLSKMEANNIFLEIRIAVNISKCTVNAGDCLNFTDSHFFHLLSMEFSRVETKHGAGGYLQ
mgnify:CR=1 FL=1